MTCCCWPTRIPDNTKSPPGLQAFDRTGINSTRVLQRMFASTQSAGGSSAPSSWVASRAETPLRSALSRLARSACGSMSTQQALRCAQLQCRNRQDSGPASVIQNRSCAADRVRQPSRGRAPSSRACRCRTRARDRGARRRPRIPRRRRGRWANPQMRSPKRIDFQSRCQACCQSRSATPRIRAADAMPARATRPERLGCVPRRALSSNRARTSVSPHSRNSPGSGSSTASSPWS